MLDSKTIRRWARTAGMVAATGIATAINPALGAGIGSAMAGAATVKKAGKKLEERGGPPIHLLGAPVAALGIPSILAELGIDLAPICRFVIQVCESDMAPAAVGGMALVIHQLVRGAVEAWTRRDR